MNYDICIIGGGIVGLATAYQILEMAPETQLVVLEKETGPAAHQTGHNSGVIHSGIYYKPGSLKAKNCIQGYDLLLDFCRKEQIPFELCGKVIVATDASELLQLEKLYQRGIENGLEGLTYLSPEEIHQIEPHVAGIKGIKVPQTGIIDYTAVCQKLETKIKDKGADVFYEQKVCALTPGTPHEILTDTTAYFANKVVNCAGLYSDEVAEMQIKNINTRIIPFRGEYYQLKESSKHLVKHLIYPVPDPNFPFLGVHFTRMMNGHTEAGPNAVLAFRKEGYKKTDISLRELFRSITWPGMIKVMSKYWRTGLGEMYRSWSKAAFVKALQKLIPELRSADLEPAPSGVRAQACDRDGGLLDDFKIIEKRKIWHVINAPSPAATSSLSIGKTLAQMVVHTEEAASQ